MYSPLHKHILLFGQTGGWSFGTQKFKDMVATRYTRQTFIYSAVPFLRQRNFDGLDIDWEYPKGSDDKKNLVQILKGWYTLQVFEWKPAFYELAKFEMESYE